MIFRPARQGRATNRSGVRRLAASAIEFAFVAPVFFMILFGIFEYARFLFTLQLLNNAAREGARFAVVNTTAVTTTDIQNYVNSYLAGQGATQLISFNPTSNIQVYTADPVTGGVTASSWTNAAWGSSVGVRISGTYNPILPGLLQLSSSLTIQATCIMASEAN